MKGPAFNITRFLYASAFIEGSALMGVEILSSKIIAPYYGASLYVWAAIIGITMGGLAIGYYFGGIWSEKKLYSIDRLMLLYVAATIFLFLMPAISRGIMERTLFLDMRAGIFFSGLVFMLPLFACFGMISPVIIRLLASNVDRIGYSAGVVYTVSTLGGILFTFFSGFYLISEVGVRQSTQLVALLVALPPLIYFFKRFLSRNKKRSSE